MLIPTEFDSVSERTETVAKLRNSIIPRLARDWFSAKNSTQWANFLAIQLVIVTLLLRLLWLSNVPQPVIFDEPFYVNAARIILQLPVAGDQAYANQEPGIDPNKEHMPLVKLMIAGSIAVLGDNPMAWRLPSVFFGTLAVAILYLLVRQLSGRPWLALMAAFIFSFDNLVFVHGRIATLDMPMVGLMLLGVYLYVTDHPALSGGAFALSALAKVNGGMGLVAVVAFEALRFLLQKKRRSILWKRVSNLFVVIGTFIVVFMVALWPMDRFFSHYQTPIEHLTTSFSYGTSLRNNGSTKGIASMPWQWLLNEKAIPYYVVNIDTTTDGQLSEQTALVKFTGEMNPYIIMMLPIALGYLLFSAWRRRDNGSLLLLALFGATYGQPLFFAIVFDRISYIFYMLPVLPALCAGIAYFLLDRRIPRLVPLAYCAAIIFAFTTQFPFRSIPS